MAITEFPEVSFVDINKKFLDVLGFKKEEIIGKTAKEINIIFDYKLWKELLESIGSNAKISEFEQVILTKAGEKRLVKFSGERFIVQDKKYLICEMNDITQLRIAEDKKNQFLAEMEILSDTANGLLKCNSIPEIHKLVGEKIMELLQNDAFLILSDRDENNDFVFITGLFGIDKFLAPITNLLGKSPFNIRPKIQDMTEEEIRLSSTNQLEIMPGCLYSLSTRIIPKSICYAIETLLGIKTVYVMGFIIDDIHYGGVAILHKKDNLLYNKTIIETIINQGSVVLHKKKIEEI